MTTFAFGDDAIPSRCRVGGAGGWGWPGGRGRGGWRAGAPAPSPPTQRGWWCSPRCGSRWCPVIATGQSLLWGIITCEESDEKCLALQWKSHLFIARKGIARPQFPLPLLRLTLMPLGNVMATGQSLLWGIGTYEARWMKSFLHCNEIPFMRSQKRNCTASVPLPLLRLTLIDALGQCNGDRSEFALRNYNMWTKVMKNVLHCNENPIYVFPEKELRCLSPAAPAAAHIDALRSGRIL